MENFLHKKILVFVLAGTLFVAVASITIVIQGIQRGAQVDKSFAGYFLPKDDCSVHLPYIANELGIASSEIHECEVEHTSVDGDAYDIVLVHYGEVQDCPSGCFYKSERLGIRLSDYTLTRLPVSTGFNYFLFPLPEAPHPTTPWASLTWEQMNCDPSWSSESSPTWKLAKQNGQLGYEAYLEKPLVCSREKVKSQIWPNDYSHSEVVSDIIYTEWSGTVFVTLSSTTPKVTMRELSREEIRYTLGP